MAFSKEELKQFEELLDRKLDQKFDEKLAAFKSEFKSELIVAVGEMIEEQMLPQLTELEGTIGSTTRTVNRHERVLVSIKKTLINA